MKKERKDRRAYIETQKRLNYSTISQVSCKDSNRMRTMRTIVKGTLPAYFTLEKHANSVGVARNTINSFNFRMSMVKLLLDSILDEKTNKLKACAKIV